MVPTAPLVRLQLDVIDRPENPYRFESFLNVAAEDQAQVLADLAWAQSFDQLLIGNLTAYALNSAYPAHMGIIEG